ncbi:hypothetical protein AB832_00145 [Flavobacteriaceae bacterium (ex Bugula neritina AB1)]|nr:hypothetical protein AB832_00145 [Flavobacteriaceae bacterium (ex Bugula neritina AB1)]
MTFYHQLTTTDCGAACLCMILSYYNRPYSLQQIKKLFEFTRVGVSMQDIIDNAGKLRFSAKAVKLTYEELVSIDIPVILYWKQDHFLVYEKTSIKSQSKYIHLSDPAYGRVKLEKEDFCHQWKGGNNKGVAIILQPIDDEIIALPEIPKTYFFKSKLFKEFSSFFIQNKAKYILAILLILVSLVANWLIPLVFEKIIDTGIGSKQWEIVFYFLLAQLVLFISSFVSDFASRLILTKFNFILNIGIKKSLLNKLLKLPINFYDTRLNTETLQRFSDQNKIQNFLTWKGMELILSVLNIIVFLSILLNYSFSIFSVYITLTIVSITWVLFFLKERSILEYAMFLRQSENSNKTYEMIMNMPEIKINNAQHNVIEKITFLQDKINKLELKSLFLNNYQTLGVNFLSKLKEIIAIGLCAFFIINSEMTLGVLLSISYVLGQLIYPINNLVSFIRDTQDAQMADQRLGEIYNTEDENSNKSISVSNKNVEAITIDNVSFKYPGNNSPYVLKDISVTLPPNSVTAIVGTSGSGKTTLLKLLLAYYEVSHGKISIDQFNMTDVYPDEWRDKCGVVLQDGKIFSGTIAENIAFSEKEVDFDRIQKACSIAEIQNFIESLPMHYHTKIGNVGIELSGGQKQRILIARAIYKNPQFLFLDEATSALDAENEKRIHENLKEYFKGRTVLIIAHRLSTVKNADQVIVLKNGSIVEQGSHLELVENQSDYFNLVKNQLELGA